MSVNRHLMVLWFLLSSFLILASVFYTFEMNEWGSAMVTFASVFAAGLAAFSFVHRAIEQEQRDRARTLRKAILRRIALFLHFEMKSIQGLAEKYTDNSFDTTERDWAIRALNDDLDTGHSLGESASFSATINKRAEPSSSCKWVAFREAHEARRQESMTLTLLAHGIDANLEAKLIELAGEFENISDWIEASWDSGTKKGKIPSDPDVPIFTPQDVKKVIEPRLWAFWCLLRETAQKVIDLFEEK